MPEVKITAKVNTKVTPEGTTIPKSVTVKGAGAFNWSVIWDIAKEAVDSYFGSYHHDFVPSFDPVEHADVTDKDNFQVRVVGWR